jgi:hypothetical protein
MQFTRNYASALSVSSYGSCRITVELTQVAAVNVNTREGNEERFEVGISFHGASGLFYGQPHRHEAAGR